MSRLLKSITFVLISLLIFAVARTALLLAYPGQFESLSFGNILTAYFYGLRFDLSILAMLLLLPLLLMNIPLPFGRHPLWVKLFAWSKYIIVLGISFLLAADILYYQHVNRHMGNELLLLKDDAGFGFTMAFGPYKWYTLLFTLFAIALGLLWRHITNKPHEEQQSPAKAWATYALVFILLVLAGRGSIIGKPVNVIDAFSNGETSFANLVLNGVFTAAHASFESKSVNHHFMDSDTAQRLALEAQPSSKDFPVVRKHDYQATGRNLVFVMLESWDPKYIDSFRAPSTAPQKATPVFDSLAAEGMKYMNFYAAGQRSIEGAQAVLTGLPVLAGMPVLGNGLEVSNITRLGKIAGQNGYDTLFVQSAKRHSFRMNSIAAATGFSQYYGKEDIPLILDYPEPDGARFGWDYETLMFLKQKLDQAKEPFLGYVFTGTTHLPFPPLGERFEKRPHSDTDDNGLLNTLEYADWSIGEFMKAARQSPWFDNTVFIFCADHTWGNYSKQGSFLEKFRIPLLIYAPKIYQPKTVDTVGSQLDLMPTMMQILGFNNEYSSLGQSLFSKAEPAHAFVTEGANIIGLITRDGYLRHSLQKRLESNSFSPQTVIDFDAMERKTLALDQMAYESIIANNWARP